jgi:hypothetical protein
MGRALLVLQLIIRVICIINYYIQAGFSAPVFAATIHLFEKLLAPDEPCSPLAEVIPTDPTCKIGNPLAEFRPVAYSVIEPGIFELHPITGWLPYLIPTVTPLVP